MAWSWQKEIVRDKRSQITKEGDCNDTLIILQHPPVYTLGTASTVENVKFDMKNAPFNIYRTERGGEVTYHGPGQVLAPNHLLQFGNFLFCVILHSSS